MFLTQTVAPTDFGISFAEIAQHLLLDASATADGAFYMRLVAAAARVVQERSGKAIGAQTWQLQTRAPSSRTALALPITPVTAITAISYYDATEVTQNLDPADFYLLKDDDRAWMQPRPDTVWPSAFDRADNMTITFTAGFTVPPETLRHAILLLVAYWDQNREAASMNKPADIPLGVAHMIDLERVGWFGG